MARRYRGLEVIPGLSGLTSTLKHSVKGTDVLFGIGAFLAAHFAVKWVMNKYLVGKVPEFAIRFTPLISGVVAAVALPIIGKKVLKLSPAKISGLAMGGVAAGVAVVAMQEAKGMFPAAFADYNDLRLSGLILEDPALRGMLLNDDTTALPYGGYGATDFNALAAAGSDEDDEAFTY